MSKLLKTKVSAVIKSVDLVQMPCTQTESAVKPRATACKQQQFLKSNDVDVVHAAAFEHESS